MSVLNSRICESCGCLLGDSNISRTTSENPALQFCAKCDDIAPIYMIQELVPAEVQKLPKPEVADIVNRAMSLLVRRVCQSAESIVELRKALGNKRASVDIQTILRSMYDASLQAEYMVSNRGEAAQRAQDYFDFQIVERHLLEKSLHRYENKNKIVDRLAGDYRGSEGELELTREFARVAPRFQGKDGKPRRQWHDKDLRIFCRDRGREEEYDYIISVLHRSTHSTASAFRSDPRLEARVQYVLAGVLVYRVVSAALDYCGIVANQEWRTISAYLQVNILS